MFAAYITHSDCQKHDMGDQHPESPQRLGAINDQLLISGLLDHMQCYDAPLVSAEQLLRAHDAAYLEQFAMSGANVPEDAYTRIDPDTRINPYSYRAAQRAAGAAVLATDLVLSGQARVAFCNVRPPGHHAERAAAGGFCFFNNVAIAIRHAQAVYGIARIALVDFDVHHGNGSEDILHGDMGVLMCSSFEKDIYPFSGAIPRGPNMLNIGLPARSGGAVFRAAVSSHWLPALEEFAPQIVFISAGFDGHKEDDMGNLGLVEADFAWITRQLVELAARHAGGRIVSCLEGGYELSPLARSVAAHVRVLIGAD
ncbi:MULTISPECIES: histone deacetylase family protein [unclassified Undibacterium]|uniref:histone deacetylase family protein n=1 Tax=unclassified Undibacterium TaxID=2630295 RepID=UPI002AC94E64|nr:MULTISPECIES: histone deacetylase family protein [unclassified Undibacterium]MEB0139136.1 histone deacetylase family protein [Undibacterium sp. CCC2.1]MEB0172884.1 histone deacetylase family protein [Undibacterium sp. CCC1.1]MEB0176644.1 histone deacetylase family protein [Undibacterium sp. CCC3.4]MEB0216028.1 histone deacetylase family protein [Undibacterium sp. 5I2]WPX43131.1 histone deacetylase family protein [Undibacterium sp. CCC3.4]